MITIDELNAEIAKLEAQTQTYQTIERLAALYTVRDHHTAPTVQSSPPDTSPVQVKGDSPFLALCSGEPVCDVLAVVDELMTTLQTLTPRLYDAVMCRLRALP